MRRISLAQRRARLVRRHLLARPGATVEDVADGLVALHSSDPATVHLSARARVKDFEPAHLEDALYERRSLVRMLGMRRTLFVVTRATAAAMNVACTRALVAGERRRLIAMLEGSGLARAGRGRRWLDRVMDRTLDALHRRGVASARELTADVPELAGKIAFGEGRTWAGEVGVSTRVLFLLATEGRIVRARPLGTWLSGQYRWAPTDAWLGAPLPEHDHRDACETLLRSYLRAFGPATATDVRWWTGWTAKLATATLAGVDAVEVALDEGTGYVLEDDVDVRAAEPVAFLPSLDPTVMGWKERTWFLGDHAPRLFDANGNAGPTIWAGGRVVGAWGQTKGGDIEIELVERADEATRRVIERERDRLREWLGDVRVTPRFRSPVERELSAR